MSAEVLIPRQGTDRRKVLVSKETATVKALLEVLEDLPARKAVSLQVVSTVDDPESSAAELAGIVAADAALTSRLLRLANSAYYGLSGRIATLQYAITILGFSTVRALALADALGMDEPDTAPEGFWENAALVGVATSAATRWTGWRAQDALCAGLLHDLGMVLLHRFDREGYEGLRAEHGNSVGLLRAERAAYGLDHAAAAARVLEAWSLPEELVRVVRTHHDLLGSRATPAERSLSIGRALAHSLKVGELSETALREASGGRVHPDQARAVLAELAPEAAELVRALTSTS